MTQTVLTSTDLLRAAFLTMRSLPRLSPVVSQDQVARFYNRLLTLVTWIEFPKQPKVTINQVYLAGLGIEQIGESFQENLLGLKVRATKAATLILWELNESSPDDPIRTLFRRGSWGTECLPLSLFCQFLHDIHLSRRVRTQSPRFGAYVSIHNDVWLVFGQWQHRLSCLSIDAYPTRVMGGCLGKGSQLVSLA